MRVAVAAAATPPRYAMNVSDFPSTDRFNASSDFELKLVTAPVSADTSRVSSCALSAMKRAAMRRWRIRQHCSGTIR